VWGTVKTFRNIETDFIEDQITSFGAKPRSSLTSKKVITNPVYQVPIIIFSIFFAEILATVILAKIPALTIYQDAFLDSSLLILITSPILYFIVLRPLQLHLGEFKQVEKALRENENFLQTIIETAPECIKLVSSDGTLLAMNRAGLAMIEADSLDQVKGRPVYGIVSPEHRGAFKKLTEEVCQGKKGMLQFEIIGKKGRRLWLETHAVPLCNEKGEVPFLLGITRDITERMHAERALSESEEKYRSLVESTDDYIYVVDRNYRYVHMNKKHIIKMGFSGDEYMSLSYGEFHTPEETNAFMREIDKVFETGEPTRHEHRSLRDGGYFAQTLSPVKGDAGQTVAVTIISKDITEYKKMEEKLRTLSLTDELTGLYNRRGFFTLSEQLLKSRKRKKKGVFLLYADLDNLKEVNDTFGHQAGDEILGATAAIFKDTFRESDIIARIGGDEFVVIPIGNSRDDVEMITERLRQNIENRNAKKDSERRLSISFGTSYYDPESPCSIDELVDQAEKLMYEQKINKRL
jgi:diguanylate cyclase (GGDEF)-like protein/PAS domain S-box-containing protein